MIISHEHQFIFIHCRKVGGSTIKSVLAHVLGPEDLQIGSWPEAIASGARANRRLLRDLCCPRALQHLVGASMQRPLWWRRDARWHELSRAQKRHYRGRLGRSPAHPPAARIRAFAPQAFRDYTKFCFVRNPYEKVVSDYFWCHGIDGDGPTLRAFLERIRDCIREGHRHGTKFDNWPMYTIDDALVVDRIGRYERFESDLADILEGLGLDCPLARLPVAKNVRGSRRESVRSWFGRDERRLVEDIHGREIDTFGYTFAEARL